MKEVRLLSLFLVSTVLMGCAAQSSEGALEKEDNEVFEKTIETTETSAESTSETTETSAETISETTETSAETISETTVQDIDEESEYEGTTYSMRQIDIEDDVLSDGKYYLTIDYFDDDLSGGIFNVYGYGFLTQDDVDSISIGDVILWDVDDEIEVTMKEETDYGIKIEPCYKLEPQADGTYHLCDTTDGRCRYQIFEDYHLDIASDLIIWDGVFVYGKNGNEYSEYSYQYQDIDEFIDDLNEKAFSVPALCVIVEDNTIKEMYINPSLHQGWKND